jgi:methylmalonyl-CoA carboxyltransferase 12S subunit
MSDSSPPEMAGAIEELRRQLAEMTAKLTRLESAVSLGAGTASTTSEVPIAAAPVAASPVPIVPTPEAAEAPGEDIVLVLAAAVAAFLGERARVHQIRLISSSAWAQQGRVSIQGSHRLER